MIDPTVQADLLDLEEALRLCRAFNEEEVAVALEILREGITGGADGDYACFSAKPGQKAAGYVCVGKTPLTQSTWHLYWLCVHPSFQRQGIGTALVAHAEAFVRSRRGQRLVIETSGREDYQRQRRFYERLGYELVGRIADYYRTGDDCIFYCRALLEGSAPDCPKQVISSRQ